MHDVTNIASSHNTNFDQFHIKATYIVTLSCFMYIMKFKKCYSSVNFDDPPDTIGTSPIMMQNKTLNQPQKPTP